jgi:hypothetical protein
MRDTLLRSVKELARQKLGLREKGRLVAQIERRLVGRLSRVLPAIGYHLVPVPGSESQTRTTHGTGRVKRLRCPKCDRRFAHPLPMARHMSAAHGTKKTARKAAKRKATRR